MNRFLCVILMMLALVSYPMAQTPFAKGADVGWLSEMEASGRKFYTATGVEKDLFDILKEYCINSIRLRVWVNPANNWSGQADVVNLAKRAHQKGFRLMIDFHYSDSWADPGQQTKPAAWASFTVPQLEQAVYDHTHQVLTAIKNQGVTPEWVQIGNETNDGMLWPEGRASTGSTNMANYARFVKSGHNAAKAVFPNTKTVVHVANGFDNGLFRWNIGGLTTNGALFNVIAMSLYPEVNNWDSLAGLARSNMDDMVNRYNKPVMVSEIGLGVGYPTESKAFIESMITRTQGVSNQRGLGVFWWEPQAYNWRGYSKVAWANTGRPTVAMDGFKIGGCSDPIPPPPPPVQVTFRVNMTGQNTAQGVYITGTMTGPEGSWQLLPMTHEGNQVYSKTFSMLHGDSGAYYYLNANNWANRETVPSACAKWYSTDRGYKVPANGNTYSLESTWAQCEGPVRIRENSSKNREFRFLTRLTDLMGRWVKQ